MVGARSNDDTRREARALVTRAAAASTSVLVFNASSMSRVSVGSPRSRQNGAADTAVLYCADRATASVPGCGLTVTAADREGVALESVAGRADSRATALYAGATRTLGG
jgi:hypothetical protein